MSANKRRNYPFRVFVSYAREDKSFISEVDKTLRELGMLPVWDSQIQSGKPFTDEIKRKIATAHLFMVLFTRQSESKPWVHQEIGFANGIDVPVLAIGVDTLPGGMIQGTQAVTLRGGLRNLRQELKKARIDQLVLPADPSSELERLSISAQIADYPEERAKLLVSCARNVPKPGRVRQRAIFSSFALPKRGARDPLWDKIPYEPYQGEYYRGLLSKERNALEGHAKKAGCSLILYPFIEVTEGEALRHRTQLKILLTFLKRMKAEAITVGIPKNGIAGNLTLVGDWMLATAAPPRSVSDYRGTFFTRHAPTVLRSLLEFDAELDSILRQARIAAHESRDFAVARIQKRISELPS